MITIIFSIRIASVAAATFHPEWADFAKRIDFLLFLCAIIIGRRMRDFGWSALWGWAATIFLTFCVPVGIGILHRNESNTGSFSWDDIGGQAFVFSAIPLLYLIVIVGIPKGDPGENKYGVPNVYPSRKAAHEMADHHQANDAFSSLPTIGLARYIALFVALEFVLGVGIRAAESMANYQMNVFVKAVGGLSLCVLAACIWFVREQNRAPEISEQLRLTILTVGGVTLRIALAILLVIVWFDGMSGISGAFNALADAYSWTFVFGVIEVLLLTEFLLLFAGFRFIPKAIMALRNRRAVS